MWQLRKCMMKSWLVAGLFAASLLPAYAGDANLDSPDGTVRAVLEGIQQSQLGVFWQVLPSSYQSDINGLVREVAAKIDADIYNQGLGLAGKATVILKDKKSFFLNHPMLGAIPPDAEFTKADIANNWDSVVNTLHILLNSELSNITSMRTLDMGLFLSGTLSKVMQEAYASSAIPFPIDLKEVKVELVSVTEGEAIIKVIPPAGCKDSSGNPCVAEEKRMTRFEGKWLPSEMVTGWQADVEQAKAKIAMMDKRQLDQMKPQILGALAMADGLLSQVGKAATQNEFNTAISSIVGLVMGPPGAGPAPVSDASAPGPDTSASAAADGTSSN